MIDTKTNRILKWLEGYEEPPWSIQIQPSNQCNLNCLFCARRFEKNFKDKLSDKRLLNLIDEAAELGVKQVELTGMRGEPMIRKVSFQLMERIKKRGMMGNVLTNGTLFDSKDSKKIVEMDWDTIVFSIDAPNAKTHDYLRGVKGTFDKVIKTIKEINKWKKNFKSDKPTLLFLTVLNSRNYDKINNLLRLAYDLNVEHVQLRPMIVHELSQGELDSLRLNKTQLSSFKSLIIEAKKTAEEYNVKLLLEHELKTLVNYMESNYERDLPKKHDDLFSSKLKKSVKNVKEDNQLESLKCLLPFTEMVVFAEGTVSPCCILWEEIPKEICDSVLNKTLSEIWYGDIFSDFRSKIKQGDLPKCCDNCFL